MAWFRMDDGFHSHPKVIAAGNGPVGLWVRCGTWSAHYETDGTIPLDAIAKMGKAVEVKALVAARLWVETDAGMLMPDFLDFNPSHAQLEAGRKSDAARKREQRAKGAKSVDHDGNGQFVGNRLSHRDYGGDE